MLTRVCGVAMKTTARTATATTTMTTTRNVIGQEGQRDTNYFSEVAQSQSPMNIHYHGIGLKTKANMPKPMVTAPKRCSETGAGGWGIAFHCQGPKICSLHWSENDEDHNIDDDVNSNARTMMTAMASLTMMAMVLPTMTMTTSKMMTRTIQHRQRWSGRWRPKRSENSPKRWEDDLKIVKTIRKQSQNRLTLYLDRHCCFEKLNFSSQKLCKTNIFFIF